MPRASLWQGEYTAIQADDKHATASLANWTRVLKALRTSPIGDNYDLSRFKSIEGAVCYPYPVFTLAPQAATQLRCAAVRMLTFPEELRDAFRSTNR